MTLPFTADTCAHAAIAAARALGDHPVDAMTATGGRQRRSIGPAAWAVHLATLTPVDVVSRSFRLSADALRASAVERHPSFVQAFEAAKARLSAIAGHQVALEEAVALAREVRQPVLPKGTVDVRPALRPAPRTSPGARATAPAAAPASPALPDTRKAAVFGSIEKMGRSMAYAPKTKAPEHVTSEDRALIDAALAAGKVTVLPAGTAAGLSALETQLYAAPPPMGEGGWRVAHQQKKAADMARRKRMVRDDEAA